MSQATQVPETVAENPVLYDQIWSTMHKENNNWMGAVVGDTGSGKSWAAVRLAEAVDPDFTAEQIAFSVEEFMELVIDDSLGRGSMIVLEEASVEANAQEWWSKSNKVLRQVLDTWRNQNRGALFTLPAFKQLDKGARGRMSALIEMVEKNERENYTRAKYKYCQQNPDTGKIYKKYPMIDGIKYERLEFRPPSGPIREAYEERKSAYTSNLNEELLEELREENAETEQPADLDAHDIAETIINEETIHSYVSENHGQQYIDRDLIELEFDVGRSKSKKAKKLLKRETDLELM
jgi:hypothetical protein